MAVPLRTAALVLALSIGVAAAPARAAQTRAFVLTTDFSTGSLSAVDLDTRAVGRDVSPFICSDAVMRWHDGLLYVVNRFGCDNILVLDPSSGYAVVRQFSTGNGTNPQDIVFVSPTRAYVTLYERAGLLIVNPQSGATVGEISLAPWADADGVPEMHTLARRGGKVFVALQRLDRNAGFIPTDSSLVAVIDASADTVVDADPALPGVQAILLAGKNPATRFALDPQSGRLLIGCVGRFGALDGGIEWIDPAALQSDGIAITESALAGDIGDFAWNGAARSYAIVSDASFNTALVAWSALSGTRLGTLFAPGGFALADCEVNDRGELYVCDNDFFAPGLFVFSTASDLQIAGPLDTGLPPRQVEFDGENGGVAHVPAVPEGFRIEAKPNPTAGPIRIALSLPRPAEVMVELHDLSGRRLREWQLGARPAGEVEVRWGLVDARGARVPPGIYFVRVRTTDIFVVRPIVVVY